ncbi:hypothetical protein Clacol_002171 [Clathrus columnatus]|uniref:Uncharacterized protein n=1 Tax=Clathrus columnatus TaxID=1419009 RepID=A0AAV5A026_9AGAM|nr:hypothetical protein Clacol_002171 [Clathrus columnatus]
MSTQTSNNRQYKTGTKVRLWNPYRTEIPAEADSSLKAPPTTIFTKDDVLRIMSKPMDLRRPGSSLGLDTQFLAYIVSATKTVQEQYKAGTIERIKHTDLSDDKNHRGNGPYSPVSLERYTKAYLKNDYSNYRKGTEVLIITEPGRRGGE